MQVKSYKHPIGGDAELKAWLEKLKAKGFRTNWNYMKQEYSAQRRVGDKIFHIIIKAVKGRYIAYMHLDKIESDSLFPSHRAIRNYEETELWGKKLIESMSSL